MPTALQIKHTSKGQSEPKNTAILTRALFPLSLPRLSLEQAIQCPEYGAPLVVLGAPLTVDADAFKTASGDLEESLRMICKAIHAYGNV